MDTDSFIVYIKTDEIYLDITKDVETWSDTWSYELEIALLKVKNKKVIGLMRDELGEKIYYTKTLCIWSSHGHYFSAFRLNTEIYQKNFCIQSHCKKKRTRKSPNTDHFLAVIIAQFAAFGPKMFSYWTDNNNENKKSKKVKKVCHKKQT